MTTPKGKILTGDAIPSIFPNYPKQSFTQSSRKSVGGDTQSRRKQAGPKSRVEVVDGYEIEYDDDSEAEPITVTIDDEEDPLEMKKPTPTSAAKKIPNISTKSKPTGKILEITDPGYNLQYILDMKERIQLPQTEFWMYRMMIDKETKMKCLYICEIVSRLERLMVRRSIKVKFYFTIRYTHFLAVKMEFFKLLDSK